MAELSELDVVLRLGAAMVAGGLIGLNRDLHGKPAGVRTLALVSLGAALAAMLGTGFAIGHDGHLDAISRVVQGVLTGIGFLGAGVIFKQEPTHGVVGLTTAAAIWLTAALGLVCGLGFWRFGLIALVMALVILKVGPMIEALAHRLLPHKPLPGDDRCPPPDPT